MVNLKGASLVFVFLLIVSLSFVSAGLFSKKSITGNAVDVDAEGWTKTWFNIDGPGGSGDYETERLIGNSSTQPDQRESQKVQCLQNISEMGGLYAAAGRSGQWR